MKKNTLLIGSIAALVLVATGAGAYLISSATTPPEKVQTVQVQAQNQLPPCDDKNIVGMALGGVAGGVLGNQVGSGKGKTAATVGGAAGGAYLGQKFIPTDGATCR